MPWPPGADQGLRTRLWRAKVGKLAQAACECELQH